MSGEERSVGLVTAGEPLWPVRWDWLNRAAMISLTQAGALAAAEVLGLSPLTTSISAAILMTAPDWRTLEKKGLDRAAGALLGGLYALAAIILLAFMPHFALLLALIFYGMFLAAHLTKSSVDHSYTFLQTGLVIPLVLIGPTDEIGSVMPALQRLLGVGTGLLIANVVYLVWSHPSEQGTTPIVGPGPIVGARISPPPMATGVAGEEQARRPDAP